MNKPYVKEYDENGTLTNPIKRSYATGSPNRKQRRAHLNTTRFVGNGNTNHLTVTKMGKFFRRIQLVPQRSGKTITFKRIEHYSKN